MGIMSGKKGLIFGVSNKRGIAYAIAQKLHQEGAEIAFTYAGDIMKDRVTPLAKDMNSPIIMPCDVTNENEMKAVFEACEKTFGRIDFLLHAVAFANKQDLMGNFSDITKDGWDLALGVSAYSLISMTRLAKPLMPEGSAICALSYLGGERAIPNYNMMGVAKAALECNVRYLAQELGPHQIRVNSLSAGPVKTLAAKGISGFDYLLNINAARAPMKRNISLDEVGSSGLYLLSPLSSGVTGENLHVDCGYHSIAGSKADAKIIGIEV